MTANLPHAQLFSRCRGASKYSQLSTDDPLESKEEHQNFWKTILPEGSGAEVKSVLSIAWALTLSSFLQWFLQSTSVIMSGHLSALELDSVSLANSIVSVLGIQLISGMSTAFDTFFSQSYGSGNKKVVGIYLQRAVILSYLTLFCVYCIHLNIEPILVYLGQKEVIALMAGNYIIFLLPGLFCDFAFQTMAKYLQNQNRIIPPLLCALVGNIVNITSQYISIYVYGYGYLASAICQSGSFFVMATLELSYILCSGVYKETWGGLKLGKALEGWGSFMSVALPGIMHIALEAWCFEIGIIVAGFLGTVQMGAQAVIFQLETLGFMFALGISVAVTIRTGQKLGNHDAKGASAVYKVSMLIMIVVDMLLASILFIFRYQFPTIFTNDGRVIEVSSRMIPIAGVFMFVGGIVHVLSGALLGCGHQVFGAATMFVCYYLIGLPLGISLTFFTPLKISGFWIGLLTAIVFVGLCFFFFFVFYVDWKKEVERAEIVASLGKRQIKNSESTSFCNNSSTSSVEDGESIDIHENKMYAEILSAEDIPRNLLMLRSFIIAVIAIFFLISIATRLFVPKSWRPNCLSVNNETIQLSSPPIQFCNTSEIGTPDL